MCELTKHPNGVPSGSHETFAANDLRASLSPICQCLPVTHSVDDDVERFLSVLRKCLD